MFSGGGWGAWETEMALEQQPSGGTIQTIGGRDLDENEQAIWHRVRASASAEAAAAAVLEHRRAR